MANLSSKFPTVAHVTSKRSVFFPYDEWYLGNTQNPGTEEQLGSVGSGVRLNTRPFDDTAVEFMMFNWRAPIDYDEARGISFRVYWAPKGTDTGDVAFELRLRALNNGNDVNQDHNAATTQLSVDTALGTAGKMHISPESDKLGWALQPDKGEWLNFRLQRFASSGSDTYVGDIQILGVEIFYYADSPLASGVADFNAAVDARVVVVAPTVATSRTIAAGSIADDAVWTWDFGENAQGTVIVTTNVGADHRAIIAFGATSSLNYCEIIAATGVEVATGALAGTTGNDGVVTVSTHTDRKIYIENRSGGAKAIWVTINSTVAGGTAGP